MRSGFSSIINAARTMRSSTVVIVMVLPLCTGMSDVEPSECGGVGCREFGEWLACLDCGEFASVELAQDDDGGVGVAESVLRPIGQHALAAQHDAVLDQYLIGPLFDVVPASLAGQDFPHDLLDRRQRGEVLPGI